MTKAVYEAEATIPDTTNISSEEDSDEKEEVIRQYSEAVYSFESEFYRPV